ncbi:MAG: CopG family transcriptional regulator [Chloroflexi bacterium]|nr:CopG family transcriptional regulator [Chloroflexota bacterium]
MGVRRQIYLDESDERLLEAESRSTGLSVSELIRRAVQQCYGAGRRLSWDEVFAHKVRPNTAIGESWVYDDLLDAEYIDSTEEDLAGKGS